MLSLTRAEALTQARIDFSRYVDEILRSDSLPRGYVSDLGRYWDRRLASLARLGSDLPVSAAVVSSLMILAREIRSPDLDVDAAVRWIDVFPNRVADLFPPSDVTFRLIDEVEEEVAAESTDRSPSGMASAA